MIIKSWWLLQRPTPNNGNETLSRAVTLGGSLQLQQLVARDGGHSSSQHISADLEDEGEDLALTLQGWRVADSPRLYHAG